MKSLTKRGVMNEKGTLMKKVFISTFLLFNLALGAEEKISFNEQVRPILADRCYHCHGRMHEHLPSSVLRRTR